MGNSMAYTSGLEASAPRADPIHARQTAGRIHTSSLHASKNVSDIQPPDTDQQLASTETSRMEVPASHIGRPSKPSTADSTTVSAKTSVAEDSDRTTGLPPDDSVYGPSLWTGELGTRDGSRTGAPGAVRYILNSGLSVILLNLWWWRWWWWWYTHVFIIVISGTHKFSDFTSVLEILLYSLAFHTSCVSIHVCGTHKYSKLVCEQSIIWLYQIIESDKIQIVIARNEQNTNRGLDETIKQAVVRGTTNPAP